MPMTVDTCTAVQREWDQTMANLNAAEAQREFAKARLYLDDLGDIDRRGTALNCPGPTFAPERPGR
jgi:hypothetical protein